MQNKTIFTLDNLTKVFGSVPANDHISLEIREQEILAIIGENGAGKSTFCKMLTGVYQPDGGRILKDGKEVAFHNAMESRKAGVSMVYQERNLINYLTGAQNICLGLEERSGMLISDKKCMEIAKHTRDLLGLSVPLDVPVGTLGAGEQQLIEIMRAFHTNPQLLILDEPTASLGEGEVEPFLEFIRNVKHTMNIAVIFISHKIEEVFSLADRIAVFTDGVCTLQKSIEETSQEECIQAMLRQDKVKPIEVPQKNVDELPETLSVNVDGALYDQKKHRINVSVHAGEVVGLYGLVGAGRTEFAEVLFGLRKAENFAFQYSGQRFEGKHNAAEMLEKGMILIPEKRSNGIFHSLSIVENVCNLFLKKRFSNRLGFVDFKACNEFTEGIMKKNKVKYKNIQQSIAELSGGNIQKVIIGRSVEIDNIRLLILDEPTTGMDLGAKNEVYLNLRKLADQDGIAILFISSELDELMACCDRMYVFSRGNTVASLKRGEYVKAQIIERAISE